MKQRLSLLLIFLTAFLCGFASPTNGAELTAKDLSQFTPIAGVIAEGATLVLYEGLPHPMWEADALKKEKESKKTVEIHGFPFYERTLTVAADDAKTLRRLCSSPESFNTYSGPKRCGGFHPDYCLAWQKGDETYHLLICFSCQEMKFHGPKQELITDIRTDAFKELEATLKKYSDQRPKRGTGE